jgi:cytochrome c5
MVSEPHSLYKLLILLSLVILLGAGCSDSPGFHTGGQSLFASRCAFCHGSAGRGDGPVGISLYPAPPDFTTPVFWQGRTRASLEKVILQGVPGSAMFGHQSTMSEEELGGLVDYLLRFRSDGGDEG